MATTPKEPTSTSGFTDEQRSELQTLIAEAVKSGTPPPTEPAKPPAPSLTDAQWDAMSDRQRESFVRSVVDHHLTELARGDELARLREKVDGLGTGATPKPEPEKPPTIWNRLQAFIWGTEPEKAQ